VGLLNLSVKHPWMIGLMYGNVAAIIGVSIFVIANEKHPTASRTV